MLDALSVVAATLPGVPEPIEPGEANVAPLRLDALRFGTLVVEATENGAVQVASVEVSWPDIDSVVMPVSASPNEPPSEKAKGPVTASALPGRAAERQ